jgi:hypothetical protein
MSDVTEYGSCLHNFLNLTEFYYIKGLEKSIVILEKQTEIKYQLKGC